MRFNSMFRYIKASTIFSASSRVKPSSSIYSSISISRTSSAVVIGFLVINFLSFLLQVCFKCNSLFLQLLKLFFYSFQTTFLSENKKNSQFPLSLITYTLKVSLLPLVNMSNLVECSQLIFHRSVHPFSSF